ncbi:uncharacterized protein BO80DRAFT_107798 [Aspergillus ibericus CBS 121593]|uniref:Uncharacterized protein n=1 Tax=Aspergillus ibericus CBS 121593 TaxID=1448316 RepID=A0A395GYF5_9EURO|nr:hypothetical protein BO80DRAFT_107798 [Aspergillus ibericus CBS 121593]RAL00099.1 hypothetical protein BO80DRAFT_107798 [Aspergillus ibericus CBS 121593]
MTLAGLKALGPGTCIYARSVPCSSSSWTNSLLFCLDAHVIAVFPHLSWELISRSLRARSCRTIPSCLLVPPLGPGLAVGENVWVYGSLVNWCPALRNTTISWRPCCAKWDSKETVGQSSVATWRRGEPAHINAVLSASQSCEWGLRHGQEAACQPPRGQFPLRASAIRFAIV